MSDTKPLRIGVWCGPLKDRNPFVDLFSEGLRSAGATVVEFESPMDVEAGCLDVVHIHWPEQVFWSGGRMGAILKRALLTVRALRRFKASGAIVVWMVHNLRPHDLSRKRRAIWSVYSWWLCRLADGAMTLSPGTIPLVHGALPGLRMKPIKAVWMPAYPRYASTRARGDLRHGLGVGLTDRLFGCFGLLRPYKGVETLIEVFKESPEQSDRLLIAGPPSDPDYVRRLKEIAADDRRIQIDARYLSNEDFAGNCLASDVIVLPFNQSLHSSSIVHALSEERPVLTPTSPFAAALAQQVGPGWVNTYERPLTIEAMVSCVMPVDPPKLEAFAPEAVGCETIAYYRSLISAKKRS